MGAPHTDCDTRPSQGAAVGMPLISDPGSALVRAAVAAGYQVIPVPGPSAFLLALVASGLASTHFTFAGFLADKAKGRQQQLQDLAGLLSLCLGQSGFEHHKAVLACYFVTVMQPQTKDPQLSLHVSTIIGK